MPKTLEEKRKDYENKKLILVEQKKLKMMTQDQFDKAHSELVAEIFGTKPTKE